MASKPSNIFWDTQLYQAGIISDDSETANFSIIKGWYGEWCHCRFYL